MLCLLLLLPSALHTQPSTLVASITPAEAIAGVPAILQVELAQGEQVERVHLVYRPFAESEFTVVEMELVWNTARSTLQAADIQPPFLEYYLVLTKRNQRLESHPLSREADPFATPPPQSLRLWVRNPDPPDDQILFLSPEQNARLEPAEVVVSVSLLRADSAVSLKATRILLDGIDVTAEAIISEDLMIYAPGNFARELLAGNHTVAVKLFRSDGSLHRVALHHFTVKGEMVRVERPPDFRYKASIQMESRHETIGEQGTWYNRASVQASGQSGIWAFRSQVFVTSDEKSDRQPQNRFFLGGESPWLKAGFGDANPMFPGLILSGKRVRGLHTSARLAFFNLDLALGKTRSPVEGALVKRFPVDSLAAEQALDSAAAYAPIDAGTWGKFRYGTYNRDFFAIRPSFGSGETWQVGFTWLKSKDDIPSIRYGTRPEENAVAGVDFVTRFDEGRVELTGQGALSAFNSDISSGTFSDEYIDSVYTTDAQSIKNTRNFLKHFITVNDNLRPLSFKRLSTLAVESSLGLDYFDNRFKITYLYRGSDYHSFGQTFLRTDVHGFNAVDRIRMFDNTVVATLGYERLQDNTSRIKIATTTYTQANVGISYYPRTDLPSITVGYSRLETDNRLHPDSLFAISDGTNRFLLQSTYDLVLGARHSASLVISSSRRNDQTRNQLDVDNHFFSLGVSTRYAIPLQTSVSFSLSLNELPAGGGPTPFARQKFHYSTLAVNGRYALLDERLALVLTVSPTFGDFTRTALDLSSQYYFIRSMSILVQFAYFHNQGSLSDNVWSFQYRFDL